MIDVIGDGKVVYKGCAYDLRSGEKLDKVPGFAHHLDGRYLEWQNKTDTYLEVHHPGGRTAKVYVSGGNAVRIVGEHLVYNDDARKPWLVVEAATGKELGRVESMVPDATFGTPLYNAQWFDPRNDRTLWLCEGSRLAELEVATRGMLRTIAAPDGHVFLTCAALGDGTVLALVRTVENKAKHNRSGDRLALYDRTGKRVREVPGEVMFIHALGDAFIVSSDRKEQFELYDASLSLQDVVPMFEPGRDGFNRILPLPSGREWIGIGGKGEWDHYGEPGLGPQKLQVKAAAEKKAAEKKAAAKEAAKEKAAAKRPGAKKPAPKA